MQKKSFKVPKKTLPLGSYAISGEKRQKEATRQEKNDSKKPCTSELLQQVTSDDAIFDSLHWLMQGSSDYLNFLCVFETELYRVD